MADEDHRPDFAKDFGLDGDQSDDAATIKRLADMSPFEFDRVRKVEAERMGVRATVLELVVQAERNKGRGEPKGQGMPVQFRPPEPWPEPVDGAVLLDDLAAHFTRHLILPAGGAHAMALWSVHCHCFTAFAFTPRLQFKAATKGAGKSMAIELLKGVVPKALETETITQAFLFRVTALAQPTLLLDEADTYLKGRDAEDVRGLINAGCKPGAMAGRCVGDNQEPRLFPCHAPVALAGIGSLPGTIEDRAIKISMKRRLRTEHVEPVEDATHVLAAELQRKAARWARDHADELRVIRPDMHPLINRAADRWRALFAIADVAGGEWPDRVRAAQAAITGADGDDADSLGERLLADVREVWNGWVAEHPNAKDHEMPSADIVAKLVAMEGRPWAELPGRRGGPLTPARLARLLAPFRIYPSDIGPRDARHKGYALLSFSEAFDRHLS